MTTRILLPWLAVLSLVSVSSPADARNRVFVLTDIENETVHP